MTIRVNNRGVTLVELLVAISLFSLVTGMVAAVYVTYVGKQKQQINQQFIQQDLQNFFDTLDREIRTSYGETLVRPQANKIEFYNQEQNKKGAAAKISRYYSKQTTANDPYIIYYYNKATNADVPLTSSKIDVKKLLFTVTDPAPTAVPASATAPNGYITGKPMRVTVSLKACITAMPTDCIDLQTTVTSRQINPFSLN